MWWPCEEGDVTLLSADAKMDSIERVSLVTFRSSLWTFGRFSEKQVHSKSMFVDFDQRILIYFVRGKITVLLTCLTGLDWTKQDDLLIVSTEQSCWINQSKSIIKRLYALWYPLTSFFMFYATNNYEIICQDSNSQPLFLSFKKQLLQKTIFLKN